MRRSVHYHVAPRYTPGSPAMVDEDTARRVAREEQEAYEHALSGVYGTGDQEKAQRLGLRGIVESRLEQGSGKRHAWATEDLCTGETFLRLMDEALRDLGWKSFGDFDEHEQKLAQRAARLAPRAYPTGRPERGFYKRKMPFEHVFAPEEGCFGAALVAYEPELVQRTP